jgi:hypothetical protein
MPAGTKAICRAKACSPSQNPPVETLRGGTALGPGWPIESLEWQSIRETRAALDTLGPYNALWTILNGHPIPESTGA